MESKEVTHTMEDIVGKDVFDRLAKKVRIDDEKARFLRSAPKAPVSGGIMQGVSIRSTQV